MKTDKQLFKIFEAVPDWIFQLTGLPSPGECQLRSFTVKALAREADGVVIPEDPDQPVTVVEFQLRTKVSGRSRLCCWANYRAWKRRNRDGI